MPKVKYIEKRFRPETLALVGRCNAIIKEYTDQGFVLTLRQLYYQLVARNIIPNRERAYKNLSATVSDARLAGLIDWLAIEDRTRELHDLPTWTSPSEMVKTAAGQFRMDMWADQHYRPEVWIEKSALVGIIQDICDELDVPYFSCRGYDSQTEMWIAAQRSRKHIKGDQTPVVFYLGDFDPSGMDMSRDIVARLSLFVGGTKLKRLALTMDQVEEYKLPPNPAKTTDSRYAAYIAEFGEESWELDALEPVVIAGLVRSAVEGLLDAEAWQEREAAAEGHRRLLGLIAANWDKAVRAVARKGK